MKFFENKKLQFQIILILIILICIGGLTDRLTIPDTYTLLKVEEYGKNLNYSEPDSLRPLIKTFNSSERIVSHPYLNVIGNKVLAFFIPGFEVEDPIYSLFIFTICMIFLIRVKNIDSDKPFSPQLVEGFKLGGAACLLFALIDYFRLRYIDHYVRHITHDTYRLESFRFFSSGLAWAGIIILWIYRILQKAEKIQTEQELTV